MLSCCNKQHAFDSFRVAQEWWPAKLRCLIIGESPGKVTSTYFYDLSRPVRLRRNLLHGLYRAGFLPAENLHEFRRAGFAFDHAIRCNIHPTGKERVLAKHYQYPRVALADHLGSMILQAPKVWVMGYVARNAVAYRDKSFAQIDRPNSPPYVAGQGSKYFVSRYLLHIGDEEIFEIVSSFKSFQYG